MFSIANLARYAIGADLAPVMRAQVSGLETSSERKRAARRGPLTGISVEEGAKNSIEPGIGAPPCKSVHGACKELMPCHGTSIGAKTMPSCSTSKKGDLEVALEWGSFALLQGRLPPCAVLVPCLSFSACPPPWPKSELDWPGVARSWP